MGENNSILLDICNLKVSFRTSFGILKAVDGFNLSMKRWDTLGLIGESGAGKSVTALSIIRLLKSNAIIQADKLEFDGEDLLQKNEKELQNIRGSKVSMIFQDPNTSLNPTLKIGEQIAESIMLHQHLSRYEIIEKTYEMMKAVNIADPRKMANCYPHELSGGMKQRVMAGMALSCNPMLLICDEPTSALDVTVQAQILDLINDLKARLSSSVLLVTHDFGVIAEMCDNVIVMYAGKVMESAPVEEIFDNAMHPYTQGLLMALPPIDRVVERLDAIGGTVLSASERSHGCPFRPRCQIAMDSCEWELPLLIDLHGGHRVACFKYR